MKEVENERRGECRKLSLGLPVVGKKELDGAVEGLAKIDCQDEERRDSTNCEKESSIFSWSATHLTCRRVWKTPLERIPLPLSSPPSHRTDRKSCPCILIRYFTIVSWRK